MNEQQRAGEILAEVAAEFASSAPEERWERIEAGRVRDFLAVLGADVDPAELDGTPAPPLFIVTLGRTRRPQPRGGARSINVRNEFELIDDVRVGALIGVRYAGTTVQERPSPRGFCVAYCTTTEYVDEAGTVLARGRQHGRVYPEVAA